MKQSIIIKIDRFLSFLRNFQIQNNIQSDLHYLEHKVQKVKLIIVKLFKINLNQENQHKQSIFQNP